MQHLTTGRRWEQFTGRKIVAVAYDSCCSDPDAVCSEWPSDCEFIVQPNVPGLQEVATFLPTMEMIESKDVDEFTTRVHCKGSTQPTGHGSHGWLDLMAAANLDYPELVDCMFATGKNIVGAFRSHGLWAFPGYHNWHYAGSWFTFRHSRIFGELDWRNVHPNFMGVEAWPGIVPVVESGCLFFDNANTAHLYSTDYQRDIIAPSMKWWHKSLGKCGLRPISEEHLAKREPETVS